jgi:curved DNA-binding protein CbpA
MGNNLSSSNKSYDQYYESLKQQKKEKALREQQTQSRQSRQSSEFRESREFTNSEVSIDDVDPYEIFGLTKNFEWDDLKNSYKRLAKLVHPDKGGSEEIFNKVTECFKYLAHEYKLRTSDKQHHELKKNFNDYSQSLNTSNEDTNRNNFTKTDKTVDNLSFQERFNKAFDDNRLNDDDENKGYGHMMAKSSKNREDLSVPTYIKPGKKFDNNSFNKTFETVSLPASTEVVKYREPEALPIARKMQYTEIGENVDDFTSTTTNRDGRSLQYTDYMKAYTATRFS